MDRGILTALDGATSGGIIVGNEPLVEWRRIAALARAWAARLAEEHPVGRRLALLEERPDRVLAGIAAGIGAGCLVLPVSPQTPEPARRALLERLRFDVTLDLPASVPPVDGWPDRPPGRLVLATSGTTGQPLGAVLSPDALLANARDIVDSLELGPTTRTLCVPPPHHAYGLSVLTSHALAGGTVVWEPRSAFPATLLETATRTACTCISAVPTTWLLLMRGDLLANHRPPTLTHANVAGGALPATIQLGLRHALGPAGLFVMYGQTEACARLACLSPADWHNAPTSCGRPLKNVELAISDDGEVLARGPSLMDGYLDEEDRTREVLADGWLHTGDLGRLDDSGRLHLVGRKRHMLKVGGTRVAPLAVEAVVLGIAGVEDACVVGAPDPLLGEVPVVYATGTYSDTQVMQEAAQLLGSAERPRKIIRLPSLPRLPGGKVDVQALAERARRI